MATLVVAGGLGILISKMPWQAAIAVSDCKRSSTKVRQTPRLLALMGPSNLQNRKGNWVPWGSLGSAEPRLPHGTCNRSPSVRRRGVYLVSNVCCWTWIKPRGQTWLIPCDLWVIVIKFALVCLRLCPVLFWFLSFALIGGNPYCCCSLFSLLCQRHPFVSRPKEHTLSPILVCTTIPCVYIL